VKISVFPPGNRKDYGADIAPPQDASAAGSTITVQDEGVTQSSTVTTLNLVGANVTASGAGATETITVAGVQSVASADSSVTVTNGTTTADLRQHHDAAAGYRRNHSRTRRVHEHVVVESGSIQTVGMVVGTLGSLGAPPVTPIYTTPLSMTSAGGLRNVSGHRAVGRIHRLPLRCVPRQCDLGRRVHGGAYVRV
jgi:hypothetical protein